MLAVAYIVSFSPSNVIYARTYAIYLIIECKTAEWSPQPESTADNASEMYTKCEYTMIWDRRVCYCVVFK